MKKRKFILLIFITTLGLTGIISLQAYWLNEAWKIKEEEFDTAVMNSLDNVSKKVSHDRVVRILNSIPLSENTHHVPPAPHFDNTDVNSYRRNVISGRHSHRPARDSLRITVNQTSPPEIIWNEEKITTIVEERTIELERTLDRLESEADRLEHMGEAMEHKLQAELEHLEAQAEKESMHMEVFTRNVMDTLYRSGIDKPIRMVENLVSEIIIQMESKSDEAGNFSDSGMRKVLAEELAYKKIVLPFEYNVYSQSREKDVLLSDTSDILMLRESPYKIYLSGTEGNFDELSVYFPGRKDYVLQSMAGIISVSGLVALLAVAGFILLVRMLSQQQKISEMKTQFINNMTHEFKTPLATTLVAASTLNNPKVYSDPEQIRHYTDLIKEENRIMNRQIEVVLQAALLDKNKLVLKSEPVDLNNLIQKTADSLRFQAESGAVIDLHVPAAPAVIRGDADHLQQVLANLVTNAVKYSNRKPEITIALTEEKKYFRITVKDNGIGIAKKDQKYIFDAFYRVSTGNIHNVKGFGLGLNYVKKIMECHKGTITVSSEPGKGSVFNLTFPRP